MEKILKDLLSKSFDKRLNKLEQNNVSSEIDLKYCNDEYQKNIKLIMKLEEKAEKTMKSIITYNNNDTNINIINQKPQKKHSKNKNQKQTNRDKSADLPRQRNYIKIQPHYALPIKKKDIEIEDKKENPLMKSNNNNNNNNRCKTPLINRKHNYMKPTESKQNKERKNNINNINNEDDDKNKELKAHKITINKVNDVRSKTPDAHLTRKRVNKTKKDSINPIKIRSKKDDDFTKDKKTTSKNNFKIVNQQKENNILIKEPEDKEIINTIKSNSSSHSSKQSLNIEDISPDEIPEIVNVNDTINIKPCLFDIITNTNASHIYDSFIKYLDDISRICLFSSCKSFKKNLIITLKEIKLSFENENNIKSTSTLQELKHRIRLKYNENQLKGDIPSLELSESTLKIVNMLNSDTNSRVFIQGELKPEMEKILIIYRIFFQLLNNKNISNIKSNKLFWNEARKYIMSNIQGGKFGDYFISATQSFDFKPDNVYRVKKIVKDPELIKPKNFSCICGTTGFVSFIIKDCLEYCGVIENEAKNNPIILLNNLTYLEKFDIKLMEYIQYLNK